ncbi:receptor-type tyrosine-protein phosphatase kappa-like isoform X1 [Tigriopus californicus]|uniref:receptor-type tyrosine-protein phosphatase kappa-like isoform X1 n=1 Tax=Tigriopus californicus TaxID=6832 RepID=UPI0027DA1D04|nr:receptor-type tyrosine-protein phosphatase kappa-like isoform X1 [Tigriopus californicus]
MVSDSQQEHRGRFPSRTDREDEDENEAHGHDHNEDDEDKEAEEGEAQDVGAETPKAGPRDEAVAKDHILRPPYSSLREQTTTIARTRQRGVGGVGAGVRLEGERITSQSLPSSTTHTPRRKGQHLTGAKKDSASQTNHDRALSEASYQPRGRGGAMGGADSGSEWPFGPEDDYVHGYSEDEGDENHLDMRMSRFSQPGHPHNHGRSKSMMRYNEIERERSKRRQHILKQKTGSKFFPGTFKLSLMNSGVIPLKKAEKDRMTIEFYEKPIAVVDFEIHCAKRRKYPVLLQIEYNSAIKERENHAARVGNRRSNHERNQNPKIFPYDYNRVVLEAYDGECDYINASYVDSLIQPRAYIVTQGPTETTIGDFWRMVWQERASCIVMVTRTFDFIRVMCVQYWPAGKHREEVYCGVGVTVENEEQLANFMIRTLKLRWNGEMRKIILFHYTEWPCHSNPFSNALLEFRRRVRNVMNNHPERQDGPVIVHCNDGAGRSGVYITIDANIELSEEDGVFDVYGYLKKIRQQRRGLVESLDQYKFVYDTLEEFVRCGYTFFPVKEISPRLREKSVKRETSHGRTNCYEREYMLITNQTPRFSIGDCAAGHRADNRDKNRNVLIVPPDNFRPYITSFQGNNCTDYINAVFVDGYTHPREYIVTEWPLSNTCSDIWSLVYDHDCSSLVVLCNPTSAGFPSFWPENTRSKKYGQVFTVEHVSHLHTQNIRSWVFRINKKIVSLTELMAGVKAPSKTCQLFQLMCWPQGHKVPTSTNALVELMNMVEKWRQKTDYGPVVVISQDGQSRAGVYCAANACIEQVIQHGEVDVFQAVKTVRRHRPQLVENITEYKYCYDLVLHYVLHYLNKDEAFGE